MPLFSFPGTGTQQASRKPGDGPAGQDIRAYVSATGRRVRTNTHLASTGNRMSAPPDEAASR